MLHSHISFFIFFPRIYLYVKHRLASLGRFATFSLQELFGLMAFVQEYTPIEDFLLIHRILLCQLQSQRWLMMAMVVVQILPKLLIPSFAHTPLDQLPKARIAQLAVTFVGLKNRNRYMGSCISSYIQKVVQCLIDR